MFLIRFIVKSLICCCLPNLLMQHVHGIRERQLKGILLLFETLSGPVCIAFILLSPICFPACESWEFTCNNGQCRESYVACNRRIDCHDGSDETNCSKFASQPFHSNILTFLLTDESSKCSVFNFLHICAKHSVSFKIRIAKSSLKPTQAEKIGQLSR